MNDSTLLDVIPIELLEDNKIIFSGQYTQIVQAFKDAGPPLKSPLPAKNINEFYDLVKNIIVDRERRENVSEEKKIVFTEEEPDYAKDDPVTITFSLVKREPGAFSSGGPMRGRVKNYTAILREEIQDPEDPQYKKAILGYFHDNEIKFTVWARTNKVANERALWFEGLMQEYRWYFAMQGVSRLLFLKREADSVSEVKGQKLYGRPLHFYVRTETLQIISEKTLQQISVGPMKDEFLTVLKTT